MILRVYINLLGWPLKASQEEIKFPSLRVMREILVTLVIFFSVFSIKFLSSSM